MNPIYKEVYQHFLLSDEDIIQIAEKHQKVEIEKGKYFCMKVKLPMNIICLKVD